MARYIDADKLKPDTTVFLSLYAEEPVKVFSQKRIDNAPTVDAVPVVRCKDCAFYEEAHYEDNGEPPYIKTCCSLLNRTIQPNDFCSYAERKEFDNGEIHQS